MTWEAKPMVPCIFSRKSPGEQPFCVEAAAVVSLLASAGVTEPVCVNICDRRIFDKCEAKDDILVLLMFQMQYHE